MTRHLLILIIVAGLALLFSLLAFVFIRRSLRKRSFVRLDELKEHYRPVVKGLIEGTVPPETEELRTPYGSLERRAVEGLLLESLEGAEPSVIEKVRRCLEGHGYVDDYIRMLKKGRPWERARAAQILGSIRCLRAVEHLVASLKDEFRDVRNMAVYSLGLIRAGEAIPHLIESLRDAVIGEEEVSVRIVKSALIDCGREAAPLLVPELENENWRIRAAAVDVLGEIGDRACAQVLAKALDDPEPDVRAKAAKGLGMLGPPGPVERLGELTEDRYWVVRMHSVRALGLLGDRGSLEVIKQRLFDSNWQVRRAASEALGRMKEVSLPLLRDILLNSTDRYAREQIAEELQRSGLVEELIDSLDDTDEGVRTQAAELLKALASGGALSPLIHALDAKGPGIRLEIVRILGVTGDHRVVEALKTRAENDDDIRVRDEAASILKGMDNRPL